MTKNLEYKAIFGEEVVFLISVSIISCRWLNTDVNKHIKLIIIIFNLGKYFNFLFLNI